MKTPRIIKHSRELIIQLREGHTSFALLKEARARIKELGCMPSEYLLWFCQF